VFISFNLGYIESFLPISLFRAQVVTTKTKPMYATSWEDENFPGWVQFMDSSGKRPYYVNLANPISQVTWAPPSKPGSFVLTYVLLIPSYHMPSRLGAPFTARWVLFRFVEELFCCKVEI
jgi:hypothetical protein